MTDGPALDSQAPPLVSGEPQAPPAQLLAEDAVLLAQDFDTLRAFECCLVEYAQPTIPQRLSHSTRSTLVVAPAHARG